MGEGIEGVFKRGEDGGEGEGVGGRGGGRGGGDFFGNFVLVGGGVRNRDEISYFNKKKPTVIKQHEQNKATKKTNHLFSKPPPKIIKHLFSTIICTKLIKTTKITFFFLKTG